MRGTKTDPMTINSYDTMESIFGFNNLQEHRDALRKNPVFQEFQKKIGEIFDVGHKKKVDPGEVRSMVLINYNYKDFIFIPYGILNEIKEFVKNNIDDREKIINPKMYVFLLKIVYYDKSVSTDEVIRRSNQVLGKNYFNYIKEINKDAKTGHRNI